MMAPEQLISTYGYIAVLVGTFLEGETILVLAGFAAHRGYLSLTWVILCAFLGTVCGDQLYYHFGRIKGARFLDLRPRWKAKCDRILHLLHRHEILLILGFRFLYGLRTVTPFFLGVAGIRPVRFLVMNTIGAFAWAVSVGILGFLFGQVFETVLGDIRQYERWLFAALLVFGAIAWLIRRWVNRKKDITALPST